MASTRHNAHGPNVMPPALSDAAWWALVLASSVGTAAITLRSLQLGCTIALVGLVVGTFVASRTAGVTLMWIAWLLSPWLRRLLSLAEPAGPSDPLALAPFLITACIVAIELYRTRLSRFAGVILAVAATGYLAGVPGALSSPSAAAFALFAYLVAVGCFVIGYTEPLTFDSMTLRPVLLVAVPPIAVYGILQYAGPLPSWDVAWIREVQDTLVSIGAPQAGHIRVFGTLNSPGTFGAVLGIAAVGFLAQRRFDIAKLGGMALVLTALMLTFVRGAWVSFIAATVVTLLASRGAAGKRVLPLGGALVVALAIFAGQNSTGASIVGRANTLTSLGADTSAQARVATPLQLLPEALSSPIGHGLGSAGEASRLAASSALRSTDNGYLSLIYQLGPFGALLVVVAAGAAGIRAIGNLVRHRSDPFDVLVVGLLGYFGVGMLTGDLLYGITGMILWYLLGMAVRRSEEAP
jgi:putative inorganic carbon (HCO3(-)) transporter